MRRAYPADAFKITTSSNQPANPYIPQPQSTQPVNSQPIGNINPNPNPNPVLQQAQPLSFQPQTQQPTGTPFLQTFLPQSQTTAPPSGQTVGAPQFTQTQSFIPDGLHQGIPAPGPMVNTFNPNNNANSRAPPAPMESFRTAPVTTNVAPKLEFFDEESGVPQTRNNLGTQQMGVPTTPTHTTMNQPPPLNPGELAPVPVPVQAPLHPSSAQSAQGGVVGKRPIGYMDSGPSPSVSTTPSSPMRSMDQVSGTNPVPQAQWKCPPDFCQVSIESFPRTDALLDKVGVPLGITFTPLANSKSAVPLVNFGNCGIVRCRKCRAYINPYVTFIEGGKRWKCNLCYLLNDVPKEYFSILGSDGLRLDHASRPELNYSCVEFVASAEFAQRPPQPPVYLFLIDVSYISVASGMVNAITRSIKKAIEFHLSKNERTQIGFITFNSTIQFYNLKSSLSKPRIMVIDHENTSIPYLDDLLVNPKDSQHLVDKLLDEILLLNVTGTNDNNSALGPALESAFKVMEKLGGKLLVFQSILPSIGAGKLQNRAANSKDQNSLLQPSDQFYKSFALECCKKQISCDLFLYSPVSKYIDVATIGCLAQFTGGEVNYYQLSEHSATEAQHLYYDLYRTLTRNTGFEAVMKIRMSKGISLVSHHGSFFLRGQDLVSLPNLDSDKSYSFRIKVTDSKSLVSANTNMATDGKFYVCIQAGLLYTTYSGERRIRVITSCNPVTEQLSELFNQIQISPAMNIISKLAISKAIESGTQLATAAIKETCINTLAQYANNFVSGGNDSVLMLPNSLLKFPLLTMGLIKNMIFQNNSNMIDERVTALLRFNTLSSNEALLLIHPALYNLTAITSDMGIPGANGEIVMPPEIELSSEKLDRRGIFLLDNGKEFYLWVGSMCEPAVLQALFDIQSLQQVDNSNSQLQIFRRDNEFSQRINNIIDSIRSKRSGYQWLYPVKEKDPHEYKFFSQLIHDRFSDHVTYREFAVELKNLVSKRRVSRPI